MNAFENFDEALLILKVICDPRNKFGSLVKDRLRVSGVMEEVP